jgi:predicted O-methyltransferase YrrM
MPLPELAFLYGLAHALPAGGTVVEIGSWKGRSTAAICEGLKSIPGAKLYAVDTFAGEAGNLGQLREYGDELREDRVYREFLENTDDYPFCDVLRMSSLEASAHFEDGSVDWIFIDAEHTFGQVSADLRAWVPKLKPGGLISGHDYPNVAVRGAVLTRLGDVDAWESIWYTRRAGTRLNFHPWPFMVAQGRLAVRRSPALTRGLRAVRKQIRRR